MAHRKGCNLQCIWYIECDQTHVAWTHLYVHLVLFFDFIFGAVRRDIVRSRCVYQNRLLNGTFFAMVFVPYVLCNIQLDSGTWKKIWIQCQAVINNVYYLFISKGFKNSPLPLCDARKVIIERNRLWILHDFYLANWN